MVAKTRCEYHGAKQLRGPAHGKWKNGRSSLLWGDKLPDGPRQAFQRALKEMDTRNVFVEMATYHARIEQLSGRIAKASDSDAWWVRLGQLEKRARNAAAAKDQMDLDAAMNEMMKLARRGAHEAEQWRELLSCVKDLASLKQLQGQIERDQKAYLSMSDAMSIVTTMAQSMKEAFVLIRDNWRAIDVLLGDDDLLRDILVLLEGEGSEAAMERLRNQIPRIEMSEAFNTADRMVQERLSKLLV